MEITYRYFASHARYLHLQTMVDDCAHPGCTEAAACPVCGVNVVVYAPDHKPGLLVCHCSRVLAYLPKRGLRDYGRNASNEDLMNASREESKEGEVRNERTDQKTV